jgi:hypothetical protein
VITGAVTRTPARNGVFAPVGLTTIGSEPATAVGTTTSVIRVPPSVAV